MDEIASYKDKKKDVYSNYYYYLKQLVSVTDAYNFELIRRSTEADTIQGKYYLYNLETGEVIYIYDSYICKSF